MANIKNALSDSDPYFIILPPAYEIQAQLILRGEVPEVITDGITLNYRADPQFQNPAEEVEFWKYALQNFGVELEENVGL